MKNDTRSDDRRDSERQPCECEAAWSYFNKDGSRRGRILNLSRIGCYLQTDGPVIPGASVLIRVLECRECGSRRGGSPRTTSVAEVKWCRKVVDGPTPSYGAGVRYHYPV